MRILLIDVNCKYSSTGKIVYSLFEQLKQNGHDAAVCYGRGEELKETGIYKFGLDWETNLHAALARITGLNGYFSLFSSKRLISFIKFFKPDVIHIHELHAYFVNFKPVIEYIKKKKIKVIWTFHCEYMYTGKCGHAYECEKWKVQCGDCPAVRDYPKSLFFDFTKKMFRDKKNVLKDLDFTIVTPSQWLANRVKMSFLKNKKIEVIHNGIDTETLFFPYENNLLKQKWNLENRKIVLSIAPDIMSESKGGNMVVELSKIIDDDNIVFVLIGANKAKRIDTNVLILPKTKNQKELAQWYSIADIFLICSKRETFPTTCLEALACGTPVVGFDAGGTKETAPAPYGRFVEAGSLGGLKTVLKEQMNNRISAKEIRRFAVQEYSLESMYKSYLKLYTSRGEK